MRVAVIGLGTTGSQLARLLRLSDQIELSIYDTNKKRLTAVLAEFADSASPCGPSGEGADVVVLATPAGAHVELAGQALTNGAHVVSLGDSVQDVTNLLLLDRKARSLHLSVAVGAGFAPGLTCLLVRHAADALDEVVEIAIAKAGTGGPACARQHHRAMKTDATDWIDGHWVARRGGSARDLLWFPPPIGARDAYKAALPSPLLLQRRYPQATRIAARVTATRRDRLTSRLPMLRPPHVDGGPGAVRVEVRGRRDGQFETLVYAVMEHPSVAAAAVAAEVVNLLGRGQAPSGAMGLCELADPLTILQPLVANGIQAVTFVGAASSVT